MENEISRTTGLNLGFSAGSKITTEGERRTHGFPEVKGIAFIRKPPSDPFLLLLAKVLNRLKKADKSATPKLIISMHL